MQGDMSFMKYVTYLENLCHYIKFELADDTTMHTSTPALSKEGSGKKDQELVDFSIKISGYKFSDALKFIPEFIAENVVR